MKKFTVILLVMFGTIFLRAQTTVVRELHARSTTLLSGDLSLDLLGSRSLQMDSLDQMPLKDRPGYKSPLRAALFSAVVPGLGQTYSERYWQGIAFFGAEVGLWVVYAVYQSKGDRQTTDFQNYADQHYSVVRYADWITKYIQVLAPTDYANINTSGMVVNRNPSLPPWQQVDWNQINLVEDQIMQTSDNGFTHNLPLRPQQQYYELIGKYPQFAPGWDSEINITPDDINSLPPNVSSQFLSYRNMRGNANSLYAIASTASYILVANHVFSALEAAWSAATHNKNLKMGATLEPMRTSGGLVEFVPVARMSLEF